MLFSLQVTHLFFFFFSPTNVGMIVLGLALSLGTHYCEQRQLIRKVTVRRIGGMLVGLAPSYLVLLGFLPCEEVNKYIVALLLLVSLRAGSFISVIPSISDISPTYQESLATASTIASFIPGFMVPMALSQIGRATRTDWQHIFLLSAAVVSASTGFYLLAATDKIQKFDDIALLGERSSSSKSRQLTTISGSKVLSTRLYHPDKTCAQRLGAAWPGKKENHSRSIWNMDDDEHTIQAILEEVEDDIRTHLLSSGLTDITEVGPEDTFLTTAESHPESRKTSRRRHLKAGGAAGESGQKRKKKQKIAVQNNRKKKRI